VTSTPKTFDAAQIRALLQRVGALATARGTDLDIVVLGGAAVALLFESRRTTRDIDVVEAHPQELLTDLAIQIAKAEGLAPNWLSDGARRFVTKVSRGPLLVEAPGIRAHAVSLEQLLASKLDAMRDDTDRSDAVVTAVALGLAHSSAELAIAPYLRPERYERACQELADIWQEVEDARR
jgi:predicted nucleotidyltransferase